VDYYYWQGIMVAGCTALAAYPAPASVCMVRVEPGTYDLQLATTAASPYYLLSVLNRPLTNILLPGENVDFRSTVLPQATIQLNSEFAPGIGVDFVFRTSEALGDWWFGMGDEDQLIVSTNISSLLEVRMFEPAGWVYRVNPEIYAGLEAISRTLLPGEEVNVTLDSDSRGPFDTPALPYFFYNDLAVSGTDPVTITRTGWSDVMGNDLIGVYAPDNFFIPADTGGLRDVVVPNTLVHYGMTEIINQNGWDTTAISLPAPAIGRYHAQHTLLSGPWFRMGAPVEFDPWLYVTPPPAFVRGDEEIFAVEPSDVHFGGHWSWSWVMSLYEMGLTTGTAPGVYSPEGVVSRAQMATFLTRIMDMYGLPLQTGTAFADVPAGHWAAAQIENLRAYGITNGCGGNNFCPTDPITRAEMAKFLELTFRVIEFNVPGAVYWNVNQNIFSPGFTFIDVPAEHWANIWIEELFFDGMTTGCTRDNLNLYFCPDDDLSRAQMAKFLVTAIQPDFITQGYWPVLAPSK
jgi:hypothetical protein